MKIFRNILFCTLVFLCLFCSCSGGMEPGRSTPPQEKEKEKTEKDEMNPDEDEEDDETDEDEKEDNEEKKTPGKTQPALVFLNYKVVSETEIVFEFSQPVSVVTLNLKPEQSYETMEEGNELKIVLAKNPEPATLIEIDLQVKDEYGNTDREQFSFRTKNNRIPKMQINELRTEYSKPKVEFIEFKMLSDGNLGALRVFIAGNYKAPMVYEFASVEVNENEYVVLHLRKLEESSKDEYNSLEESRGTDSSLTARDFWIPGSSKLLHKTDAVYVLDQDDKVLDAVMIAEKPDPAWSKNYFTDAAEFLFGQGAWKSPAGTVCSPADAVDSSGIKTSITRSISRKENAENTHTKADWYVTATGGVTPGSQNKN